MSSSNSHPRIFSTSTSDSTAESAYHYKMRLSSLSQSEEGSQGELNDSSKFNQLPSSLCGASSSDGNNNKEHSLGESVTERGRTRTGIRSNKAISKLYQKTKNFFQSFSDPEANRRARDSIKGTFWS